MHDLVSLGEVMLRMSPPRYERLRQATRLDVRVAGSQLNVAANLAQLGKRTAFVSKLPANELGLLARGACQGYGVDVSHLQLVEGARMGVNYLEFGATPRAEVAVYDRAGSAASSIAASDFAWTEITRAHAPRLHRWHLPRSWRGVLRGHARLPHRGAGAGRRHLLRRQLSGTSLDHRARP